jgi:ribosomal-protein-alanine N-acetyltransferase
MIGEHRDVRLRWAERADLEAIAELDQEVFPALSYPLFVLRQHMDARPQSIFLVIEEDGLVCGYALATVVSYDKKAWLLGLAVSAEHRGRHYGDSLLSKVLQQCRDSGVKRVLITVRPNNEAALGLYKKYHFHKTASEDNYYGDLEPREILQSMLRGNALRSKVGQSLARGFLPGGNGPAGSDSVY